MLRRGLLLFFAAILPLMPVVGYAQTDDRDGDGLPDSVDQCPDEAGPRENNGCPIPPPDSDGDGLPDSVDACPGEAGSRENSGCPPPSPSDDQSSPTENPPADQSSPDQPSPEPEVLLPSLPIDGPCVIATRGSDRVNIRRFPGTDAEIMNQLQSHEGGKEAYLAVTFSDLLVSSFQSGSSNDSSGPGSGEIEIESWSWGETNASGGFEKQIQIESWSWGATQAGEESWFLIPEGWVFADVTRQGGDCTSLPAAEVSNNLKQIGLAMHGFSYEFMVVDNLLPLLTVDENGLPAVQCDAAMQEIFDCDGSVHPADGFSNVFLIGDLFDTTLEGDANGDGTVDAGDFVLWRRNFGSSSAASEDPDSSDYNTWRANFGRTFLVPLLEDEVLIAFASGDPDQPFIIGQVPNADDLPMEELSLNFTKITWSNSSSESQADSLPMEQFSLNFSNAGFEGQEGGISDITYGIPGVYAAVAIPAFMKNARKAKTAAIPLLIVLPGEEQVGEPSGSPDTQHILVIAGPSASNMQSFFILPYSEGSETPSIVVKLQIAWD